MGYLLEIPRTSFPVLPPVQAPVPALPPVAVTKGEVVPVERDDRAVALVKIASQDPFLARKLLTPQGRPALSIDRLVTASEARTLLAPEEVPRFNVIADGITDIAALRASTNRNLRLAKTFSILAYGAFIAAGAAFDPAVYVGVASLVAFTLGKLRIETVGAHRVSERYHAMYERLQALPSVTDTPPAAPAKNDAAPGEEKPLG